MIKIKMELAFDQKVSSHLSLIFLMLLAFLVAWQTVIAAGKIEKGTSEYVKNNINTRINSQNTDTNEDVQ